MLFLLFSSMSKAPLIGICRHRLTTDGTGVTTLVAFHGCPLHCQYCLNPQCLLPRRCVNMVIAIVRLKIIT